MPDRPPPQGNLRQIVPAGLRLLAARERRVAVLLSVLVALVEALQVIAMLLVLPVVSLIVQPDLLNSHELLLQLNRLVGSPPEERFILLLSIAALACIVAGQLSSFGVQSAIEVFTSRIQTRLAQELLAETVAAPYSWFLERNAAELVRLFHNDIALWGRDFVGNMLRVLTHGLTILAGVAVALAAAPFSGFVTLAVVAVLAYGTLRVVRPPLIKWTNIKRQAADRTMVMETQILSGVKDIKVNDGGGHFLQLFKNTYGLMSQASARGVVFGQLPASLLLMVGQASLLLVILVLWRSGSRGGEIASQMALIVLVTSRVVPAVARLSATITSLFNAMPWVAGILNLRRSILEAGRDSASARGTKPVPSGWRHIRFVNVSFGYSGTDRFVLAELSISLECGRSYGLIGNSGAGKSTFVDLLLGLLQPGKGQILVDHTPLTEIDLRQWQQRVGYVPQVPYFTDDTIRANIAFGVTPKSIDETYLARCIDMAGLKSFIADLPQGLGTRLGDRAVKISGGQRQRIAIARALYKQPDILLMDEATASLDPDTQSAILQAIESLRGTITTLIISHQPSVVASCDCLFLLEGGQVTVKGTFDEVVRHSTVADAATQQR